MKRKWLSMLPALALVFFLAPAMALAEDYDVFIGGARITSENCQDVLNDGGSVKYDNENRTLTLTNADLSKVWYQGDKENTGHIYSVGAITINLEGSNVINSAYPNGDLTIIGNEGSTLTVNGVYYEIPPQYGTAALQSNECITIKGGTYKINESIGSAINSVGYKDGTNGTITIENASVNATGKTGGLIGHEVIILNSDVDVTATYAAVHAMAGNITIENSKVEATSETNAALYSGSPASYGYCKEANITIQNSTVNAISKGSSAIYTTTNGTTTLDASVVVATAAEGKKAILSNGTVDVTNSWVDLSSDSGIAPTNSVMFTGNNGSVYGNAQIPGDAQVPADKELIIGEQNTLTIPANVTLTNYGTITIEIKDSLVNNGTLNNRGTIKPMENITGDGTLNDDTQPEVQPPTPPTSGGGWDDTLWPNILQHPQSVSAPAGSLATFSVVANGGPLSYQWQVDRRDGKGFVSIPGATGATLTVGPVTGAENGYQYRCAVTLYGATMYSGAGQLFVTAGMIPKTGDMPGSPALLLALAGLGLAAWVVARRRAG